MSKNERTTVKIKQNITGNNNIVAGGNIVYPSLEDIDTANDDAAKLITEGKPTAGLSVLELLWKRHTDKMTGRQKYRTKANIGHAYEALGEYEKAADRFLTAYQYDKQYEKARARQALAYLLLGNKKKARELASVLLKDFPEERLGQVVWIRTVPTDVGFRELEAHVPEHQRQDAEIAFALAESAMSEGHYSTAEEYIIKAQKDVPDHPAVTETLGTLMLKRAQQNRGQMLYGRGPTAQEQYYLKQALSLLSKSLSKWQKRGIKKDIIRAYLKRSQVYGAMKDWAHMERDIECAYQIDATDREAVFLYAILRREQDNLDHAIELLDGIIGKQVTPIVEYELAKMLRQRHGEDDCNKAITFLKSRLSDLKGEKIEFRYDYIDLLIDLEGETCSQDKAFEFLEGITDGDLISGESKLVVSATINKRKGNDIDAIKIAKQAAERICESTSLEDKRKIAFLLQDLGLNQQALDLWKTIIRTDYVGRDTYSALECAHLRGNAPFIASVCEQLRDNELWDRKVFELELYYRQIYNDDDGAEEAMRQWLSKDIDECYLRIIRTRLSLLGIRNRRLELVESDIDKLPSIRDVDPYTGCAVVEVLRNGPEPLLAVEYAYNLLRLHWNDIEAHQAMISCLSIGPKVIIDEPNTVKSSVAVCYQEEDTENNEWHIIEDSEVAEPDSMRNEFASKHHISQAMMGKQVGETFCLRKDPLQDKYATVRGIVSKYVYRYGYCMNNFERHFPNNMLRKYTVIKPDGQFDFGPIQRAVNDRASRGEDILKAYKENPVPIYLVASRMGVSVLETMGHVFSHSDMTFNCCSGTNEELQLAVEAMEKADSLGLDSTALITLFATEAYREIAKLPIECVVSEGTLKDLRNVESMRATHNGSRQTLVKNGNGVALIKSSAKDVKEAQKKIKQFIAFIENNCTVESGLVLGELDKKKQDDMIECVGRPCAESMMMAAKRNRLFWTDDFATALLAKSELGCQRVWTQLVFDYFVQQKVWDQRVSMDVTLKLIQWQYYFTRMTVSIALEAVRVADGNVDKPPLMELLDNFADERIMLGGLYNLAAQFIKAVWQRENLQVRAQGITIRLLEQLFHRSSGDEIIKDLLQNIDTIFGIDVISAAKVKEVIRAWRKETRRGQIIRP